MLNKLSASLALGILSNIVALVFSTLAMLNYDVNSYSDYLFSVLLITTGIGLFQYDIGARLSQNIAKEISFGIYSLYKSITINLILFLPYGLCILFYFINHNITLSLLLLAISPLFIANQILKSFFSINRKIYISNGIELAHRIVFLLLIYLLFYSYNYSGDELKFLPYIILLLQQFIEFFSLLYFFIKYEKNKNYDVLDNISYKNTILFIRNNFLGALSNIAVSYLVKKLFPATTFIQYNYSLQFFNGLKIISNVFSSFNWINLLNISNANGRFFVSRFYNFYLLLFSIVLYPFIFIYYYNADFLINENSNYSKIPVFITIMYVAWLLNELGKRQVAHLFSNDERLPRYYKAILLRDLILFFLILTVLYFEFNVVNVLIALHILPVIFLRLYIYMNCSLVKPTVSKYEFFTIFTVALIIVSII